MKNYSDFIPKYTKNEEKFNMISHIAGGGIAGFALLICVIIAAYNQNIWGIASGIIYGFSAILLFTMSSIYHGLNIGLSKKIFRILDHCTIFILIAGTYTPILLGQFRIQEPILAWTIFGGIWFTAILGIVLNSINLKKFAVFSLICYLAMGWIAVATFNQIIYVYGLAFIVILVSGGALYTIGVIFYIMGKKIKYMHSVFHIFVVFASICHSIAIAIFIMPV